MGLVEYVGSIGGIAGVLAVLMFFLMRHLIQQMREDRKFMEDRLSGILKDYNNAMIDHTRVSSELYTYLRMRNGGKDG